MKRSSRPKKKERNRAWKLLIILCLIAFIIGFCSGQGGSLPW